MDLSTLTDNGLTLQCAFDPDVDLSCSCLLSGGGPVLNTDISGPGVRISFYLQALFLALLTALSNKTDDIANALYTLVVTNIAVVVASFILGFGAEPQMSLHDAIVVIYLLVISWTATFFSSPTCVQYKNIAVAFGMVYVVQSYLVFAFFFSILLRASGFGSTWRCNSHAVVVIFRPFPALNQGRILAITILIMVFLVYTVLIVLDYGLWKPSRYDAFKNWAQRKVQGSREEVEEIETEGVRRDRDENRYRIQDDLERGLFSTGGARPGNELFQPFVVSGRLMLQVVLVTTLWTISVINTELLILWNRFDGGGDGNSPGLWGFGQILPMFLVLLPLMNLVKVFVELYRSKGRRVRPIHKIEVKINVSMPHTAEPRGHRAYRASPRTTRDIHPSGRPWPFSPFTGMDACINNGQQRARITSNSIHDSASGTTNESSDREGVHPSEDVVSTRPSRSTSTSSYATARAADI